MLYICRCAIRCTSGQMGSLWMVVHCATDRVRKIGSSLQPSAGGRFIFPSHTCTPFIHACTLTRAHPSHMHPHTCTSLTCTFLTHVYPSHMHIPHTCTSLTHAHPSHMHPHTCASLTHAHPSHMHIPHTYHIVTPSHPHTASSLSHHHILTHIVTPSHLHTLNPHTQLLNLSVSWRWWKSSMHNN